MRRLASVPRCVCEQSVYWRWVCGPSAYRRSSYGRSSYGRSISQPSGPQHRNTHPAQPPPQTPQPRASPHSTVTRPTESPPENHRQPLTTRRTIIVPRPIHALELDRRIPPPDALDRIIRTPRTHAPQPPEPSRQHRAQHPAASKTAPSDRTQQAPTLMARHDKRVRARRDVRPLANPGCLHPKHRNRCPRSRSAWLPRWSRRQPATWSENPARRHQDRNHPSPTPRNHPTGRSQQPHPSSVRQPHERSARQRPTARHRPIAQHYPTARHRPIVLLCPAVPGAASQVRGGRFAGS